MKKNELKILDCTLRDGGYYNNWDFSKELIDEYLKAMSAAKIEYVELGFRSLNNKGFCRLYPTYYFNHYISTVIIDNFFKCIYK